MAHSLIKITSKRDIVDTKTHASGATWHNMTKQSGFPTMWEWAQWHNKGNAYKGLMGRLLKHLLTFSSEGKGYRMGLCWLHILVDHGFAFCWKLTIDQGHVVAAGVYIDCKACEPWLALLRDARACCPCVLTLMCVACFGFGLGSTK